MRRRAAGRALTSAIPPFITAAWYDPAKCCKHCKAQVIQRLDVNTVPTIRVRHEAACPAE